VLLYILNYSSTDRCETQYETIDGYTLVSITSANLGEEGGETKVYFVVHGNACYAINVYPDYLYFIKMSRYRLTNYNSTVGYNYQLQ
jgi:hypothetical protein